MKPFDYYSKLQTLYPNKKAHRKEYDDERAKLYQEFKDDLFAEFNVTNNPKRFKCFELAWDKGHAHGHSEVYSYFSDFVELIYD